MSQIIYMLSTVSSILILSTALLCLLAVITPKRIRHNKWYNALLTCLGIIFMMSCLSCFCYLSATVLEFLMLTFRGMI